MLTKQCNLRCAYCFANEFVNRQTDEMSFETFERCLQFLSFNPNERIGLIGGEPTLHPDFKKMLARLIDSPFKSVCVFSNGILLDRFFTELRNSRFQILINLNSPDVIGNAAYSRIMDNMDRMVNSLYMAEQVGLGINLYNPDMDYGYLLEALKRFRQSKVRVSISVPNLGGNRQIDPLEYFRAMRPLVLRFMKDVLELGAAPNFDCNYIPFCLREKEDDLLFNKYKDVLSRSNLLHQPPICSPVIDILPDLMAVRCFGMSSFYKADIRNFKNTEELRRHFLLEVDACAYPVFPSEACRGCREYLAGRCSCGCYAYREDRMRLLRDFAAENFGGKKK